MPDIELRYQAESQRIMDLTTPTRALAPSVDLQLLIVMAGIRGELTRDEISILASQVSPRGAFNALIRLEKQGMVLKRTVGRLHLYEFNRNHVAADAVIAAMGLRQKLFDRIKSEVESWKIQPVSLAIFGSAARGDGSAESDIDILIVRQNKVQEGAPLWAEKIYELSQLVYKWSGNHASLIQASEKELAEMIKSKKAILKSLRKDAHYLVGLDLTSRLNN